MKTYRVNNIFYSLQGEGHNTGRTAVFVRFAGCNLRCDFCDTEFESFREMTGEEIIKECRSKCDLGITIVKPLMVLTGGEPTLQVDEELLDMLHSEGYEVAMESNGTRPAPESLDWLTVSPKLLKGECNLRLPNREGKKPDELKIVFDKDTDPERIAAEFGLRTDKSSVKEGDVLLYLQPCDTGDAARNARIVAACVEYIKAHPWWRLSLQTHKLIGIE